MQVDQSALAVDVVESDIGHINKASLHLALTIAAFLVEDQARPSVSHQKRIAAVPSTKVSAMTLTSLILVVVCYQTATLGGPGSWRRKVLFRDTPQLGDVFPVEVERRQGCSLQVNHGILKHGFPLPPIPHISVQRANVSVGHSLLALGSDFAYAA